MQCCKNSRLVPINPCLGIRQPLAGTSAFFPLRPRLTRLRTHLIPVRLRLGARPQYVARLVHNAFRNIDKMGVTSTDEQKKNTLQRVPHSKPPFTLGDIKKAIPPHCFRRSLARSFSYVAYNIFIVALLYYTATSYFHLLPSPYYYVAWPIYWVLQGCTSTGFWAIAHECGHNAFSDYRWVDDTVGFILHSALLVPYFSWKYSHRRHHSNSGSLERDESFVPKPKSKVGWYSKYLNNPAGRVVTLAIAFTLGLPLYLAFNVSGRPYERFASHFDPYGPIFINDGERLHVFISDAGVVAASYVLYRIASVKGLAWLLCVYGVPLVIVNGLFALIVYLQHTHPSLPRYDSSEWDWLRGALTTVDRDYGVLNKVFHNATDTHVVHHLFSRIPHYHAVEATKAIKPILGQYYLFDGTPIYKAIWREVRECAYVEPDEDSPDKGTFWYKNKL